jgi:hypothetical protein
MDSTNFKTKRLTKDSGYQRPIKTVQDSLTADDIKDKLKDYIGSSLTNTTVSNVKKDTAK